MKNNIIILFATIICFFTCKKDVNLDYAVISGTILNLPNSKNLSINALDQSFRKVLEISNDGKFTDTLKTKINDLVLFDGVNPVFLYVNPGDNINIYYDATDFNNTLKITGKGSEISNYLIEKRETETKLLNEKKDYFMLSETAYKDFFNKIASSEIELLKKKPGLPKDYITQETRNINYFYLSMLADYETTHKYYTKKQNFRVSDNFLKDLESIDYNNGEDYKASPYYKKLVKAHFYSKASQIASTEGLTGGMALIKALNNNDINSKIKNGLLFDYANKNLTQEKDLKEFYNAFIESSTNDTHKNKITEVYNKLKITNPGEPSPKFFNYTNNDGGTTSLDDLKGKYVYIDVWATWCGPCMREIPSLISLEKKFHNKNIEFVSISIDKKKDFEKWKKMVADKNLKGVQLFADNDWKSSFVQEYSIRGIPRFILLDPQGKIINANAPRPSNPGLISLLESLDI